MEGLDHYKNLQPNVGRADANYYRQLLVIEAAGIVGEPKRVGYWIGRFGGKRSKDPVPDNLIIPMAKRAREDGRNAGSLLNDLIKRWRTAAPKQASIEI